VKIQKEDGGRRGDLSPDVLILNRLLYQLTYVASGLAVFVYQTAAGVDGLCAGVVSRAMRIIDTITRTTAVKIKATRT
jgi:hypothetical protein